MTNRPLADKVRPREFDEIVGQEHLFGEGCVLRRLVESGHIGNMIFYGPPGVGKTTAADIIARKSGMRLHKLNATTASSGDIKEIIGETATMFGSGGVLLYLDEIQYFNKKQQQTLLEFIEDGRITLIASTTENPYLYVYPAIISRSAVFEFRAVSEEQTAKAVLRAAQSENIKLDEETALLIARAGAGDVRRAVGVLEASAYASDYNITADTVKALVPSNLGNFDRNGTVHYDMLSALQKSIRGSDPDAAVFYLAKILEGGDLIGACRRLQVIASEDIGLAYPMAAAIVRSCVESARELGMPEARIPLAHAALLLATSPKSNSTEIAYDAAKSDIDAGKGQSVPPYMRPSNSYDGYKYPHDYPNHWVEQQYLPDDLKESRYYKFGENKQEQSAMNYWYNIKNK